MMTKTPTILIKKKRKATTCFQLFVVVSLLVCFLGQSKAIFSSSSSSSSSVENARRRQNQKQNHHPQHDHRYHREKEDAMVFTEKEEEEEPRPHIHVLATSNGSPYLNWQTRIMYRTFLDILQQQQHQLKQPNAEKHMKYFTRLLHRRTDDELMKEVPTVRVDSLHPSCDKWCAFPVHDRPDAIKKWLQSEDAKRGGEKNKFVLMIETDYVFKRPMQIPSPLMEYHRSFLQQKNTRKGEVGGEERKASAIAFHFNYINPHYPTLPPVMERLMQKLNDPKKIVDTKKILASGPAPTLIYLDSLNRLIDDYIVITEEIEKDEDAKKKLGWVREMYAYSIAAATSNVKHIVEEPRKTMLISQPPADDDLYEASMYH